MKAMVSKTERSSNIELLRIVAMFFVMAVHANFYIFGPPSVQELSGSPIISLLRVNAQGISISCVDIFVLISGWFGIRTTIRGGLKFAFQCLYYLLGLYLYFVLIGNTPFTVRGLFESLLFVQDLDYWFVKAYLGLYIIAPVLNGFVEYVDKRVLRNVLIGFYLFQTLYGWMYPSVSSFNGGYSILSFMGLYLLARYCRRYPQKFTQFEAKWDCLILFCLSVIQLGISVGAILLYLPALGRIIDFGGYINPVTIVFSMYMIFFFSKLRIKSRIINIMGGASFGVYLIHTHKCVLRPFFVPVITSLADSNFFIVKVFAFMLMFFVLALLLDQPRKYLWKLIDVKTFAN